MSILVFWTMSDQQKVRSAVSGAHGADAAERAGAQAQGCSGAAASRSAAPPAATAWQVAQPSPWQS